MGNTPSISPPLVSINAPGNDFLIPYGTNLYACPPPTPGGYHPSHAQDKCHGTTECRGTAPRGPVYSRVGMNPRRKRHGYAEPDVNVRGYEEESESTKLGELPEAVRMRRKESKMKDMRAPGGRRNIPGPCEIDHRPSSAPAGCAGLRGGQGYLGMQPGLEDMDTGMNPNMMRAGMHAGTFPGMYPPGPDMSLHPSVLPQYASHESMHRYPYPSGANGMRNTGPYASHPLRPLPTSTSSRPPSPKPPSNRLPPAFQAAIDEALQKTAGLADTSDNSLNRSKTYPAAFANGKNDDWREGIDTCICTKNCKCRKGKRATKWYEGTANIGGEEVPVRAKLNTRYVLKDNIGKDCGDHTACRKSPSCSSSSSDTETSKAKIKKVDEKETKRTNKAKELEELKSRIDKMEKGQKFRPPCSALAGYRPGFDGSDAEGYDSGMMQQMRKMGVSGKPYGLDRIGGMDTARNMQGMSDFMTTHNLRGPRMPPKPGMRMRHKNDGFMEDYEDMGGATLGTPYARSDAMSGKGKIKASMPPKGRARSSLRGGGHLDSDSEPSTLNHGGIGKDACQMRNRRARPCFKLDDTDVIIGPRRQSGMKGFGNDEDGELAIYNLPKRSIRDWGDGASPRNGRSRISPSGRRGRVRNERTAGKQARAETDDDEDW